MMLSLSFDTYAPPQMRQGSKPIMVLASNSGHLRTAVTSSPVHYHWLSDSHGGQFMYDPSSQSGSGEEGEDHSESDSE
jgi:hypothetical protein